MLIESEDLVDVAEVAAIIGLSNPGGVSVYRRRYRSFPRPVFERSRCVLWLRPEIIAWAERRERERGD